MMNSSTELRSTLFIFGGVRMRPDLLNGYPPNSGGIAQPSRWMNTEAFVLCLKHFVKFVRPNKEIPVLLIVDNHSSHTSLEAINYCRDNGVPTAYNLGQLFGQAYLRAATVGTAIKSFPACGIESCNCKIFGDADFAPSMVSERHLTAEHEFLSSDDEPLAVPGFSGSNRIDLAKTKNNEIQDGKPPPRKAC
ncbi:uncharacterized protein LOC115874284 [Sitophilus oryzae]|uniref:Uncharacterized protein LOC115874284 n=1 Tax=Sitophilus oryzae TaxID=7048 RepID=A0A6J2X2P7_SITOR|nr:uncharacterized protein LOC115874284 [Sitophilus oryzae]